MNGVEWLVDAVDCDVPPLRDPHAIVRLFDAIVAGVGLTPIGRPVWHQFPHTGGVTAVWMLKESHLTIHTFPEFASASLNLFCCTPRPCPDWTALLTSSLGSGSVHVTEHARPYGATAAQPRSPKQPSPGVSSR